ncbi:GGDEF domain-containing protein [Stenotrophomonas pigmentata]|uniref:GGDEF domain-containing protein n=1 Tax=Stenotrophomonas pigmentata TaxID=3055080 RepID=UPI0026EBE0C3|nr:GGDEF domain-containing protein [Stenotrophomonas sp. 610A2]
MRSVPLRTIAPVTTLALLFFAIWLWFDGQRFAAIASLLLSALALLASVWIHQRKPRLELGGALLCLVTVGGCLLSARQLGNDALPWSYLALMSNFFIVRNQIATPLNLMLVAGLLLMPDLLLGHAPQLQALIVIVLVFGFGYHFSHRLQGDRTRLEMLASLDALTGVPNRRALEKSLQAHINGVRHERFRQGLIVIDIDNFKAVNDHYGHAAGDTALSDIAAILRFELRENDQVFRFGGEEFVILADTGSHEALASFTERLRKAVYESLRGPGGRITISVGAALYAGEQRWQDWFARADIALYEAKGKGRNSVVVAE